MLEFKPNEMHVCAMCITDVGVGLALEVTGVLPNAVGHHFFPLFYFPIFLCEDGMSSCNLVAPRAGVVVAFHSVFTGGDEVWELGWLPALATPLQGRLCRSGAASRGSDAARRHVSQWMERS